MKRNSKPKSKPQVAKLLEKLRSLCLSLPETSERSSWGHPNFVAGKHIFVTFEIVDQRPSIAFRMDPLDVHEMAGKRRFFETPYGRGQWLSLWVDSDLDWRFIEKQITRSYRAVALKRMIGKLKAR
jgi:predicted DNA-binding protein (MmcQ/YjbR family)